MLPLLIGSTVFDGPTINEPSDSWLPTAIIAALVAGFISILVTRLNHKNEAIKWQREARRESYGLFLKKCHDFVNASAIPYEESPVGPEERYRQFMDLKNSDIPLIGGMKVVQAQSLTIYEIRKYWELVKYTGLIREEDQNQATIVTKCLRALQLEMRKELSVGLSIAEWWDGRETPIRNHLKAVKQRLLAICSKLFVSPAESALDNLRVKKTRRLRRRVLKQKRRRRMAISKMRRRAIEEQSSMDFK